MLESLIALHAVLANVSGAAISRSLPSSICATTVLLANIAIVAIEGYSGSPPASTSGRFAEPFSARLHFQHAQQQRKRNCFSSPGWSQIVPFSFTSRPHSTFSSSSILFAARAGGDATHPDRLKFSTDEEDIAIPFREYGYRSTPFSWEELNRIIVQDMNLAKLSRSVPQEQDYQLALRKLKQEWKSTKDYILHSKFDLPKKLDKETQLHFADETANREQEALLRLVPNDFPYHCAPGIEHWVLWKYGAHSAISSDDIDWAKDSLQQERSRKDDSTNTGSTMTVDPDMIAWENPANLKSLPEINHVHILLRQIPKE